jgi:putative ABC transport system permease protein
MGRGDRRRQSSSQDGLMSLWSRVRNVFCSERVNRDLNEEMRLHLEEALERGRSNTEAGRAFGNSLLQRERSRDFKLIPWLDSLRADIIFGWRQLCKNRTVTIAAVLSLGLGIGACTTAFRLIDALLLRPMPVAEPDRLYSLGWLIYDDKAGRTVIGDGFDYPGYRRVRDAIQDQVDLLAVGQPNRQDITFQSDLEMEKANCQYISGNVFGIFGLKAALGRLIGPSDDVNPGSHPVAVISYDYWSSRFGRDRQIVGRTFRRDGSLYEIVGVLEEGFTGTSTGIFTDIYIPTMMNKESIFDDGWRWFTAWARVKPGQDPKTVHQRLQVLYSAHLRDQAKSFGGRRSQREIEKYVSQPLVMNSATAGYSLLQRDLRQPLWTLAAVVLLVLLIACANVANLLTAQATARTREMALRVSIGAGRHRLLQIVLIEAAMLTLFAMTIGGLLAWWAAPFVASMVNPPQNPIRLVLTADWRVLSFAGVLAGLVTLLFGAVPALRASAVKPINALKGGEDPHQRRRLMHALIAAQVAFCFLVFFVASLFVSTFQRLVQQPMGFSSERVLALNLAAVGKQPIEYSRQILDHLRTLPGVESAALSNFALLTGSGRDNPIRVGGQLQSFAPYFLGISPAFFETMKIPLLAGRDFRPSETDGAADTDLAIVNESFARQYFNGENPVGKSFERWRGKDAIATYQIVGYSRDARYRDLREPIRPTAYVPLEPDANFITAEVRTMAENPMALASSLRREVPRVRPEFRVSNITPQAEIVARHTIRERLLAALSLFFAIVALLLAGVGMYGVLNFSVIQRTREIGIRMALGARPSNIVRKLTREIAVVLFIGSGAGLALGLMAERCIASLLFDVRGTDFVILLTPALALIIAAIIAALPPAIRAIRIDPSQALRSE